MKKILSAVLATAMIASMGAVAFAANLTPEGGTAASYDDPMTFIASAGSSFAKTNASVLTGNDDGAPTIKVDDNKKYYPVVALVGPYGYNTDDKALYDSKISETTTGTGLKRYNAPVEYGDTAYYALIQYLPKNYAALTEADHDGAEVTSEAKLGAGNNEGYFTLVTESETVSSLSIKQEWEEGKELVKSVSIVKKKVANPVTQTNAASAIEYGGDPVDDPDRYYPSATDLGLNGLAYKANEYYYFVAIKYEDSASVNDTDVIGTLTLKKSKDPSVDKLEIDISNNIDWEKSWRTDSNNYEVTGDLDLKADTNYALKFNCDDEVEFTFDDDSTFTVDVSGQSKILFNYSTDYISKIAAKYPMAELNFWNGNGAKFNRVGEMFLSCEDLTGHQFLYQVTSDGKLAEVPGAEWDDSDEGFYFNTRVLGSYVISDMELPIAEEKPADNTSTVITTPITNPSTGAIA